MIKSQRMISYARLGSWFAAALAALLYATASFLNVWHNLHPEWSASERIAVVAGSLIHSLAISWAILLTVGSAGELAIHLKRRRARHELPSPETAGDIEPDQLRTNTRNCSPQSRQE